MNRLEIVAAFAALPERRRHEALRIACDDALAVWRAFRVGDPITYMDGIVGARHVVDDLLPERALAEVDAALAGEPVDATATAKAYYEPTVAMQDDDLEFPAPVAQAYYAIYNLHLIVFGLIGAPDELVVLGQVASAVDVDMDDWAADWWTRVWDRWASRGESP